MTNDLLRRSTIACCLLALASLALPVPLRAQPAGGDPARGRALAGGMCASCHRIDGKNLDEPPGFAAVAAMPSTTALSLKVFLRSNHKEMPNLIISDRDTDDLVAYILSLNRPSVLRQ
jgi:mono/diheme cytochrome c family protein